MDDILVLVLGMVAGLLVGLFIGYLVLRIHKARHDIEKVELEKEVRADSRKRSGSAFKGKVAERFASIFPDFTKKYNPSDARFLGDPIDYVIFEGYTESDRKGPIKRIVFLEVKAAGRVVLTKGENAVKDAVNNNRVEWDEILLSVPEFTLESEQDADE